jgi:hypothetical protein
LFWASFSFSLLFTSSSRTSWRALLFAPFLVTFLGCFASSWFFHHWETLSSFSSSTSSFEAFFNHHARHRKEAMSTLVFSFPFSFFFFSVGESKE